MVSTATDLLKAQQAENSLNFEKIEADYPLMEDFVDWKGRPAVKGKHGGVRATLFVYVAEALENMAFLGNGVNLVQYFLGVMHYDVKDSSTMLTNYMGTAFLLALFGAFISDSFITRFYTNIIFAFVEVIGYILLTVQAHKPSLHPPFCPILDPTANCPHVAGKNSVILYMGLYLVALGTGGLKAALPTMGAEQFDETDPAESKQISRFFNWFFFSITVGASVGVTFLVWVQTSTNPKLGWDWAFGISLGAFVLVVLTLLSGMTTYRNQVPRGSPLTSIAQVIVAAIRNRNLPLPTETTEFLDRAAIVDESEIKEGARPSPWRVCTVTQVEQVKILVRMVPIFCSTIMVTTCLAQLQTFSVHQGITMDNKLGSITFSPATLSIIPLIVLVIVTPLYDLVFVPFARRITGHEQGITILQRIGVGLFLVPVSMAIAALV
ncbi:protein NRT1/ PTR FAMILY 4.3-like [Cryptomeria japonica]|uniref:protein NRT1/ PTR FAMILY 4.3-like n=1 Tax=Cryptomeria japonica TaxID=3369 RepID=UPI0027DA2889|nr:protein NRT1/ PTR FAMILY 4.3-like [Cryptomeria japonica]